MRNSKLKKRSIFIAAFVIALPLAGALPAAASPTSRRTQVQAPPTKTISKQERKQAKRSFTKEIARNARPMPIPTTPDRSGDPLAGPEGKSLKVDPVLPKSSDSSQSLPAAIAAVEGLWSGAYSVNPNRQTGKLFYQKPDGTWGHCTATAINSENKSLVLTAGHCVYTPDPDLNGVIDGNGYWYKNFQFCPGYEYSCKLGIWYARQISTTSSWFYGDASRRYTFADDVAVVLVSPNAQGYLTNLVGGQGITFNQATNVYRSSFGYPAADWRFPGHNPGFNGQDLFFCQDTNWLVSGNLRLTCSMTGGSSGGPWLSWVNSSWMGLVNSVNSHKPGGLYYMDGPYFGNAEMNLFQYWRNR